MVSNMLLMKPSSNTSICMRARSPLSRFFLKPEGGLGSCTTTCGGQRPRDAFFGVEPDLGLKRNKRYSWSGTREAIATEVVDDSPVTESVSMVSSEGDISLGNLIRFILPSCGLWIVSPVLSLVDTAVVGTRCSIELAALGPGVMMLDCLAYLSTFLGLVVTNKASLQMSKKNLDGAGRVVSDALVIGAILGTIMATCLYIACPVIIKAMAGQASASIVGPATSYVRIRALALPAFMITQAAQSFFLSAQDPFTPLTALVLSASLNLIGDLWLVAGMGWGISGAAAATAAAQIATAFVLVRALYNPLSVHSSIPGYCAPVVWAWPGIKRVQHFLKSCGPVFGTLLVKTSMYSTLTALATGLSPVHSGAHHVVMSLFLFFCFIGESFAMAAQTFLPGFIGRPKAAWNLARTLQKCALSMAFAVGISAGLFLFTCPFIFTKSPAIAAAIIEVTPFFASVMFFHCASMVSEGILLAGQDVTYLLQTYLVNITSGFLVVGILRSMGYGLPALWWCILQFQCMRLFFNWGRMIVPGSILNATQSLSDAHSQSSLAS